VARLAVALARVTLRRRPSPALRLFFAAMVVAWAAFAVTSLAAGRIAAGIGLSGAFGMGVWVLARMRPRYAEAARRAEQLNREELERAGEPFSENVEASEPVRPPVPAITTSVLALWVFYDLFFGALSDVMDGRHLELGHAVARGALLCELHVHREPDDDAATHPTTVTAPGRLTTRRWSTLRLGATPSQPPWPVPQDHKPHTSRIEDRRHGTGQVLSPSPSSTSLTNAGRLARRAWERDAPSSGEGRPSTSAEPSWARVVLAG
jgi:hypothetical protein